MFYLASKYQEVHVFAEICMPHAIQMHQTGGPVRLIQADQLVRVPEAISFDQAAAMMLQGMTAQVLIRQGIGAQPLAPPC